MSGPVRSYAILVLLVTGLVILAVLGGRGGTRGSDQLWPPVYSVNLIAVVGLDAQIRSFRPDGSGEQLISTQDGHFTWPTWAPDGQSMVFSGVVGNAAGEPVVTLFNYGWDEAEPQPLYEGQPGFAGLLAEGVVHYPLWSPDSTKLAFVAVTERHGLTLFIDDVHTARAPEFVLDSGPLWMSWSSDSSRLAVHRSREHFLVSFDDEVRLQQIKLNSVSYRVPAWRPNLGELTLSSVVQSSEFGLYSGQVTDTGLVLPTPIAEVGPDSAFLWSPGGAHLAVADEAQPVRFGNSVLLIYRNLRVLDSAAYGEVVALQDNVIACFWSPDGSKLAVAVLADNRGGLRWRLLDVATGSTTDLVDFTPSRDQLTMFQFFDQYAYSHQLWSPDSRFLLFAGRLSSEATSAAYLGQPDGASRVYIVNIGPVRTIDEVAEGVLGFWSPI